MSDILDFYNTKAECESHLHEYSCPATMTHYCEPPAQWAGDCTYAYDFGPACYYMGVPGWGVVCIYHGTVEHTCVPD